MPASSSTLPSGGLALADVAGETSARQPMMTTESMSESSSRSRIYPITLCCCPCLPSSLTVIRDWLHLTLLVGVISSIIVVVQMVLLMTWGNDCNSALCFNRWIAAVCIIPSMIYFVLFIGSYDEDLKNKKKEKEAAVEEMIHNINELVEDLNDTRKKVTDNANSFASGFFNQQAVQFQRFLKNLKINFADRYLGEPPEAVDELRKFILQWFKTYKQTLINPETNPVLQGLEKELNAAKTVDDICEKALKRLDSFKLIYVTQAPSSQPLLPTGSSRISPQDLENGDAKCGVTWFRCGLLGCRMNRTSGSNGCMPVTMYLGCFMLKILSRTHANLMIAFLVDVLLVVFEVANQRWWSFALVTINALCIVALLACFEQINEIAVLEQQINQYRERDENIKVERDKAKEEWNQVQQLHDLWQFRTYPSLSILGKVHQHLADIDQGLTEMPKGGRGEFLSLANQCYKVMELGLGDVEQWKTSGPLNEEWKKSIGKQLKNLEHVTDVNEILTQLPIVTKDLSVLDAAPPSASPRASPCPSPTGSFALP